MLFHLLSSPGSPLDARDRSQSMLVVEGGSDLVFILGASSARYRPCATVNQAGVAYGRHPTQCPLRSLATAGDLGPRVAEGSREEAAPFPPSTQRTRRVKGVRTVPGHLVRVRSLRRVVWQAPSSLEGLEHLLAALPTREGCGQQCLPKQTFESAAVYISSLGWCGDPLRPAAVTTRSSRFLGVGSQPSCTLVVGPQA
ncbi:hypothetical protein DFH09DRAFT_1355497 [Mycena vulgaris]|nr:hypothetical protein DFH09DRAFT_1355497 [Mycena vulgaris]